MSEAPVNLRIDGNCAVVTLSRPSRLNALSGEMLSALKAALGDIPQEARSVVITGAGKAFCAGADLSQVSSFGRAEFDARAALALDVFTILRAMPQPSIAAINGTALGGGLELAMACTFRIASEDAKLGLPEIKLGVIPSYGGVGSLIRLIGEARAIEMMLTGEPISAREALAVGLVSKVADTDVVETAIRFASMVARHSIVPQAAIRAIAEAVRDDPASSDAIEAETARTVFGSRDASEGIEAFIAKRTPSWTDI